MNVHAGAEILMRCAGPFVSGYRYEGLPLGDRLRQEALQESERLLAQPPPRFFLGF